MKTVLVAVLFFTSTSVRATESPKTMGQVCVDIGTPFCQRARECSPDNAPSQVDCVKMFIRGCCENTETCSQEVKEINAEDWQLCLDAIPKLSCEEIMEGRVPNECKDV